MKKMLLAAAAAIGFSNSAHAVTEIAYSNNYDGGVSVGAGIVASGLTNGSIAAANGTYNGANGKSWTGSFFKNDSTGNPATASVLTLSNLPTHSGVSIDFLLGFINSWDSTNAGCCNPDFLDLFVDGTKLYSFTTVSAGGSVNQHGGGTQLVDQGSIDFTAHFSGDDLIDLAPASFLTFAHTGSSLELKLQASGVGWQGGVDEAWGVDALKVTLDGVVRPVGGIPEPATWAMMIGGFGLVGAAMRRQRKMARITYA